MNPYLISSLIIAAACLLGYLLGSVPTGVVIGKVFFHKDPRDYYSHNSGGTNVGRVFGKKIGRLCIFLDMSKAIIALYVAFLVVRFTGLIAYFQWFDGAYDATPIAYWGAGLFAAVGHCFSIFLGFKGGKAVACFAGLNIAVSWFVVIIGIISYFGVKSIKGIVSIASLTLATTATITHWVLALVGFFSGFNVSIFNWSFGANAIPVFGFEAATVMTIMAIIIFVRHIPNIKRLMEGTELTAK
ncbi:MAG: glycerol-3-phosphate acyltransferase [Bacilli bacterium]|nr:glycerol-3-phosphate acyltransferase [Bacilli bacterium]